MTSFFRFDYKKNNWLVIFLLDLASLWVTLGLTFLKKMLCLLHILHLRESYSEFFLSEALL
jgi:hypothetical protein